ncbi:TlpA family protein disulfide reductase [Daejeonella oryzae]|uniref:TlpA family protein disulfide reductase n=1 Tax=Daejeonella oryzae TaxID=1122943 RepID=UPI0009DBDC3C|nr:TlpA disulfide reductase family protein [Daejeonella oryzae]
MNIIKSFKSNIGFIIGLVIFLVIALNPNAKALVMRGLIKIGLFQPDVSNLKPKPAETNEETTAGPMAPAASFITSDGKTTSLENLKGKVVFINFWATWCPPCLAEMPSINSLSGKLKDNKNVVFLLIDVENQLQSSEAFMKKNKYNLDVYGPASFIPDELFKTNLPTTVILNKKGEIVFKHEGMANYDSGETETFLKELSK